jgi:hypothetical protein
MLDTPIASADAPSFAHGETTASPIPVPSKNRMREKAAAPTAPANTAAQETALPSVGAVRGAISGASERMAMGFTHANAVRRNVHPI